MGRKGRATAPELVERLVAIGVEAFGKLSGLGLPAPTIRATMREVAHTLCWEFGGQRMSIPKDMQYPLEKRDAKLASRFTGNNVTELAGEFDLTEQQVRNILAYVQRTQRNSSTARKVRHPAGGSTPHTTPDTIQRPSAPFSRRHR